MKINNRFNRRLMPNHEKSGFLRFCFDDRVYFGLYCYCCCFIVYITICHPQSVDAFSSTLSTNPNHFKTNCMEYHINNKYDYHPKRQQENQPYHGMIHTCFTGRSRLVSTTRRRRSSISSTVSALELFTKTASNNPILLTVIMVVFHVLGGVSGAPIVAKATKLNGGWYNFVSLPKWVPSKRTFPLVWTFLYSSMGISISRIILSSPANISSLLFLWTSHYILNVSWAPIFFGQRNFRLGLGINYMLLTTLAIGIIRPFYRVDSIAAFLLIPYLIWLMVATVLNETICALNPTIQGYNNAKFYYDLDLLQQKAYEYAFGMKKAIN